MKTLDWLFLRLPEKNTRSVIKTLDWLFLRLPEKTLDWFQKHQIGYF